MPSSIEKIVDGFPFPTIDPIIRTPDYESIADMHLKLNSNAASVQSNLRCGTLGLLFLTVSPAVYATLSTTTFVPPVKPGPEPSIPTVSTGAVISDLLYHHTKSTKIFSEYKNTDKGLCQLLLELQTNCMSDIYVTSTLATGRRLLERSYTIFILHTLTFPKPHSKTMTRSSVLPTTEISRSKPGSIRSKIRLTTPPQETRRTPRPKSSEIAFQLVF